MLNTKGTVISFYDATGNMVEPFADAGWPCLCLDISHRMRRDTVKGNITYRWADMRSITPADLPEPAIMFAFPPCTHLAGSGSQDWRRKRLRMWIDALELVDAAWQLFHWFNVPYMLEQPVGRLSTSLGKPDATFQPWEYGDNWTKRTCIWHGNGFVMPEPWATEEPEDVEESIWRMSPSADRANRRSVTPMGFARAVYQANAGMQTCDHDEY